MDENNRVMDKKSNSGQIQSTDDPKTEIKEVQVPVKIDRTKLKSIIENLIIKQAALLPAEVKNLQINQIIGEQFKTFSYDFNGVDITGDMLLNVVTNTLAEQIDKINGCQ